MLGPELFMLKENWNPVSIEQKWGNRRGRTHDNSAAYLLLDSIFKFIASDQASLVRGLFVKVMGGTR
jgi:hypothetical protein